VQAWHHPPACKLCQEGGALWAEVRVGHHRAEAVVGKGDMLVLAAAARRILAAPCQSAGVAGRCIGRRQLQQTLQVGTDAPVQVIQVTD
jgi:hypothetical protein